MHGPRRARRSTKHLAPHDAWRSVPDDVDASWTSRPSWNEFKARFDGKPDAFACQVAIRARKTVLIETKTPRRSFQPEECTVELALVFIDENRTGLCRVAQIKKEIQSALFTSHPLCRPTNLSAQ